jgi:hypothetical protein
MRHRDQTMGHDSSALPAIRPSDRPDDQALAGLPGHARFVVGPAVLGGDVVRQREHDAAAGVTHDRRLVAQAVASEVPDEAGRAPVRRDAMRAPAADSPRSPGDYDRPTSEGAGERSLPWAVPEGL